MPQTLRKACHACSKAKRSCQPQLPQCPRCASKGLKCTYDLEPVTSMDHHEEQILIASHHLERKYPGVYNDVLEARRVVEKEYNPQDPLSNDLPILVPDGNLGTLDMVLSLFKGIPGSIQAQRSSLFLHANVCSLIAQENSSNIRTEGRLASAKKKAVVERSYLPPCRLLLEINKIVEGLLELLLATASRPPQTDLNETFDTLLVLKDQLWSTLPFQADRSLSTWTAWTIAESARRTSMAMYLLQPFCSVLLFGYCVYQPYIESLPFDPRSGLWEARNEEQWKLAVDKHGGADEQLFSWNEFIETAGQKLPDVWDGAFQQFLFAIVRGNKAMVALKY